MFGQSVVGLAVMGLEFGPDGTLYAVGDANQASPTFNSLYSVNVTNGTFTRIGSTGAPEFFMDFAFDKNGTMYGASSHMLFTIDRKTGTATKVADFVGGGDIMGLSYDAKKDDFTQRIGKRRIQLSIWLMSRQDFSRLLLPLGTRCLTGSHRPIENEPIPRRSGSG